MKAMRSAILILTVAGVAGCDGDVVSPAATGVEVGSAFATSSGTPGRLTVCSVPGVTEFSPNGATWGPAPSAGVLGAPYGAVLPGSSWIGPYLNSGTVAAVAPGTFYFRTSFTLPAGATGVSLSGMVHADNWATFSLNGTRFFAQPAAVEYSMFQDPPDLFSTSRGFVDGVNVVSATLVNAAGGADNVPSSTALDFCYTVSYVVPAAPTTPPTTPNPPSTGDGGRRDERGDRNDGDRHDRGDDDHGDRDRGDRDDHHDDDDRRDGRGDRDRRDGHDDRGGRDTKNSGGRD